MITGPLERGLPLGPSGLPRHRSSRASALLQLAACPLERGLPANQAPRSFRPTASSFIASKLAPTARRLSVGARLARESGGAVFQAYRVIVHREQARSYSSPVVRWSEACPRIRRRGPSGLPRHRSSQASSLLQLGAYPVGAVLARDMGGAVLQAFFRVHNQPQSRHSTDAPQTAPQTVPLPDRYPGRRYGLAG